MTITELTLAIQKNQNDLEDLEKAYRSQREQLLKNRESLERALALARGKIDPERVAAGRAVLEITGRYLDGGQERDWALEDAKTALAKDRGGRLWEKTIGTKNYAHWGGQRCDCSYGFVPEHGHHVFRIGLTDPVRARDPQYLSEQEIDDALYLLHNLESIERLEAQAGKIPPVERNAESNVIDFPES